jgi:t-SNARE complex subunit (syntaxin)
MEADNMTEVISQRKEQLDKIHNIMSSINQIAKDINVETFRQEEGLIRVEKDMTKTLDNTKAAVQDLKEAEEHQKKNYRTLIYAMIGAGMLLLIVILGVTS